MHLFFFFFNDTATTEIYTLSLHDALPISSTFAAPSSNATLMRRTWLLSRTTLSATNVLNPGCVAVNRYAPRCRSTISKRSEEHTSELQSQSNLVCRLLLEKKKNKY